MKISKAKFALLIIMTGVFIYVVLRAVNIPLTHDEAVSFSLFVPKNIFDIIGYVETYGMPNNHIMNTLLVKAATFVFGDSTLAIRLPTLAATLLYLFYVYRFVYDKISERINWITLLLLISNLYILEFAGLARGYGLANAFMLAALFHLKQNLKHNISNYKAMILPCVYLLLMVLSNFTTIYVVLTALLIITVYNLGIRRRTPGGKITSALAVPGITFLVTAGLLYEPFRTIIKWNTTTGGSTGFWHDCVESFITGSAYNNDPHGWYHLGARIFFVLVFCLILLTFLKVTSQKEFTAMPVSTILIGTISGIFVQHWLLDTPYPPSRAVQFLYPLLVISLLEAIHILKDRAQRISSYCGIVFGAASCLFFTLNCNVEWSHEWGSDASNRALIDFLENERQSNKHQNMYVAITWIHEPGLNYERNHRNLTWLRPFDRHGVDTLADYYFVDEHDAEILVKNGLKVIRSFPESNNTLLKNP